VVNRRKSTGQLISSLVFFVAGILALYSGGSFFNQGQYLKCFFVYLGGILSLLAVFRFQIQNMIDRIKSKNDN